MNNRINTLLKVGHLNVRSLFTGFDHLSNLITDNNFNIMCVTETWLNSSISSDAVLINGYNFFRKDREGRGGGVGVYVQHDLFCKIVFSDFTSIEGVDHLLFEIKFKKIKFLFCVIYRAPSSNIPNFINSMDNLLSFVTPQYENICILGDINIDQSMQNIFSNCLSNYDFDSHIHEPTRITGTSQSSIDVIFSNCKDLIISSGTVNADLISDHHLVYCTVNLCLPKTTPKMVTYRSFKNFNNESFLCDLQSIPWNDIFYLNDLEEKIKFLSTNILYIFDKHAPLVRARITKPYAPWVTENVKKLMKERQIALSIYKKSRNVRDWIYYKELRNLTLSAIRHEKSAYLAFHQNRSTKELWGAVNRLNIKRKNMPDIPPHLRNVNEINSYFSSVFSPPNNCPDSVHYFLSNTFDENAYFHFKLGSIEEITSIIMSLKSNAEGCDNISALMLKYCLPTISLHITHVINCCLEVGYFPTSWKRSLVKPLPKVNNPQEHKDLRPITIIPALSKVLEKLIKVQLYDYISECNIISNFQSGFRKGFSTTSALADVSQNILSALDKNDAAVLILLDFSKAFDTLDHELLCAKLSFYGFDKIAVDFFKSYLTNRSQTVLLNEELSNICPITSGVPQGSVLGPVLFLIYTADMIQHINYGKVQCYADDTQLFYNFPSENTIMTCNLINTDLDSIHNYANQNNLKLNAAKSAVLCFTPSRARDYTKANLKVAINGQYLPVLDKAKNLGLIFDNRMRFTEHVTVLLKKAYYALKMLYCNISILNFKVRKKLCESLVLPILNYCNIVYFSCLDKLTQYRLQKMQNSCCRFVFKMKKYSHVSAKLNELKWLRLENLYTYNMSVFAHNLLLTSSPPYLYEKFTFRREIQNGNLRYAHKLTIPKYSTTLFRRSFVYNAISIYNNIDDQLKKTSVNKFRKTVKTHFLGLQFKHTSS